MEREQIRDQQQQPRHDDDGDDPDQGDNGALAQTQALLAIGREALQQTRSNNAQTFLNQTRQHGGE